MLVNLPRSSRDVWREAPPAGRCRRNPQWRNSPSSTVTRESPGRSCHAGKLDGEPGNISPLSRALSAPS